MKKLFLILGAIAILAGLIAASGYKTSNVYLTPIGGQAILLSNRTGGTTVVGQVVAASKAFSSAFSSVADGYNIGVSYQSGVTVGGLCWIVVGGVADVSVADLTVATLGTSVVPDATTAGRAVSAPSPASRSIGYFVGVNTAGTGKVARAVVQPAF